MTIRVCMLVHQDYFRDARVKRYADGLLKRNAEVDIVCVRSGEAKQAASYHDNLNVYPIPLARGYRGTINYIFEYIVGFFLYSIRLTSLYLQRRHHVIHVHNMPDFLVFAALIPKLLGAEVILDIHDPMPEFYASKFGVTPDSWMVAIMRIQERFSAKIADAIITVNDAVKNNLVVRRIAASKITVVSNFPDPKIFTGETNQSPAGRPFTMIYPGTLAPRYGLDVPIRALSAIHRKVPGARIVFLGHQVDYADELRALAEQLNVGGFVDLRDVVPIDQVPNQMSAADIGIYPALYDIHMDVATPTKVLEYAMMGLPMIASRLSGIEAIFGEYAVFYVPPGDIQAFAQAVIEMYEHPEVRAAFVERANIEFTYKHSWDG